MYFTTFRISKIENEPFIWIETSQQTEKILNMKYNTVTLLTLPLLRELLLVLLAPKCNTAKLTIKWNDTSHLQKEKIKRKKNNDQTITEVCEWFKAPLSETFQNQPITDETGGHNKTKTKLHTIHFLIGDIFLKEIWVRETKLILRNKFWFNK